MIGNSLSNSTKCSSFRSFLKCFLTSLVLWGVGMYVSAEEPNADTPNIGFENGNFTNWQLYTGYYSLQVSPDKDSSVVYDWKSVQWSEAKDRFDIMNLHT